MKRFVHKGLEGLRQHWKRVDAEKAKAAQEPAQLELGKAAPQQSEPKKTTPKGGR